MRVITQKDSVNIPHSAQPAPIPETDDSHFEEFLEVMEILYTSRGERFDRESYTPGCPEYRQYMLVMKNKSPNPRYAKVSKEYGETGRQ